MVNRSSSFGRHMFSSLAVPNYRLFFVGQLASVMGNWMQTVAQSFLVLQLTGSGTALGLTVAARYAPVFLLGPWGGVAADRFDRCKLLYATQIAAATLAGIFALLIGTGVIRLWMVYVLAVGFGLANVFDNPTRQSMISDLVDRDRLSNAVLLNSITINAARIFGAAAGGIIAAGLGLALCFALNGVSFLVVVLTTALMNTATVARPPRAPRAPRQVREGFRYVAHTPRLLFPLLMVAIVGMLAWEFQVSLPLLASATFHGGAGTYGAMTSVMGAGAVAGGLVSASRKHIGTRALALSAIGWGLAITVAALAPTLTVEYVVLLFVGYGSITFNSYGKIALQMTARAEMRGRVMALWALAWVGSTPIGGPIVGWVGQNLGARWSLLVGGIPTLAIGLALYPMLTRLDQPAEPEAASQPA
ncbi:MFS transporter [Paractinoplanes globisporus]|uniref:MFS transporter n=1 Tax=Paractinoplanes globisporus TaxID=113565 RepID=A0ABW6W7K0_9ACTN|nr:MFS transporter [Actinoplanes globisporus]